MKRTAAIAGGALFLAGLLAGALFVWGTGLVPAGGKGEAEEHVEGREGHEGEGDENHAGHEEHRTVKLTEEEIKEFGIEIEVARPGEIEIDLTLPGEVVPNADTLAHIVSRVSGIAREVKKKLGEKVKAGEVLAVIESRELADAKAAYLAGLERLSLARSNYEREEKLWKQKISAEKEFLDAKQALAESQIELKTAENKLHALGIGNEELARLIEAPDESYTIYNITAPFDGTIVMKHITLGEVVGRESEIFVIADLSTVWVLLTVYQKDLALVREGQRVEIRADKIDRRAEAVIDYVSPIVEESTRTASARVVISNRDGLWRPGIFVTGRVVVDSVKADVVIPKTALQTLEEEVVVFVETPEGFEPRPVKIGRENATKVEILSGLEAGERYAAANAFTVKAELEKGSFEAGHSH